MNTIFQPLSRVYNEQYILPVIVGVCIHVLYIISCHGYMCMYRILHVHPTQSIDKYILIYLTK